MNMQKLLVGLDFKSTIEATLETAVVLGKRLGCELLLCHAADDYVPKGYATDYEEEREVLRHFDLQLQQRCEALEQAGLWVRACGARIGPPHKVILKLAEEEQIDALLIGVSDRSPLERLILGSSAEKIVRHATCPVFLRHPADVDCSFESLLCAVEYSEHGRRTLTNAVNLARALGAVLQVLHVEALPHYAGHSDVAPIETAPELPPPDAQEHLQAFIEQVDTTGVRIEPYVRVGAPCSEILEGTKVMHPSMLILGRHKHGRVMDFLLGSVSTDILRVVPASLLVISEQDLPAD